MPQNLPAIEGIDDPSDVRIVLYQSQRMVHAPILEVGLLPTSGGTISGTLDVDGQLIGKGTATNDSAAAGDIGQVISSAVDLGSAVALTTGTAVNVTSISLTAGDWDVRGDVSFVSAAATSFTLEVGTISQTSATEDLVGASTATFLRHAAFVPGATNNYVKFMVGPTRVSLSGTTTIYLTGRANFTVSTASAYGSIVARRAR